MAYPVTCGCGKTHEVALSAAGTQFACSCGRKVDVPSLSVLKSSAGEAVGSPEFRIRAMIMRGETPSSRFCANCGVETAKFVKVRVECSRADMFLTRSEAPQAFYGSGFFGLLSMAFKKTNEEPITTIGGDMDFELPVRLCGTCAPDCSRQGLITLLTTTDDYRLLLEKYPKANLFLLR